MVPVFALFRCIEIIISSVWQSNDWEKPFHQETLHSVPINSWCFVFSETEYAGIQELSMNGYLCVSELTSTWSKSMIHVMSCPTVSPGRRNTGQAISQLLWLLPEFF